jgi:hypothetical protein
MCGSDLAMSYRREDGNLAFVIQDGETGYISVIMGNRKKGWHRLDAQNLPRRETEEEARLDLKRYAEARGWEKAY